MPKLSFRVIPHKFLGLDVGTSAIKVVELSRWGERVKLENYGELKAEALFEKPFRTFERSTLAVSTTDVARGVRAILEEAKVKTKEAIFCIPDFSTFFTWFTLPPMTRDELEQAVQYEARQHIPLPVSEVTLDWQLIAGSFEKKTPLEILAVTVPNEIINQYQEIAALIDLKLVALEAEVFGLVRSLARDRKEPVLIADIGAQSTSISLVDGGFLRRSHSFDIAGNQFVMAVARSLNIDYSKANLYLAKFGILPSKEGIDKVLSPLLDLVLAEMEKILQEYNSSEGKAVRSIILAGGSALLPGLPEYISKRIGKEIEIGNPFKDIFYPPILEEFLRKMGPSYAIAVGMALRGFK